MKDELDLVIPEIFDFPEQMEVPIVIDEVLALVPSALEGYDVLKNVIRA